MSAKQKDWIKYNGSIIIQLMTWKSLILTKSDFVPANTLSLPQTQLVAITPYSNFSLKQISLEHSMRNNNRTPQAQQAHPRSPFPTTVLQYSNLQEGYRRENSPDCHSV